MPALWIGPQGFAAWASCRLSIIVLEQSPQSFLASQRAFPHRPMLWQGHQHHIALALVRALVMKMLHILRQRMAKRRFPKEDQPRETLLFNRSHPALRVGVQIWRPWRERHSRDAGRVDDLLKGGAVFPVPVMDQ